MKSLFQMRQMNRVHIFAATLPTCAMWQDIIKALLIESKTGLGEL